MSTSSVITCSGSHLETTEESFDETFDERQEEFEEQHDNFTGDGVSKDIQDTIGILMTNWAGEASDPDGETLQNEGRDKANQDSLWIDVFKNYTLIRTSGDPNVDEESMMLENGFKILTKEEFVKNFSVELLNIQEEKETNLRTQLIKISQDCDKYEDSYFLDELSDGFSEINPKIAAMITKCRQSLTRLADMNATLSTTYKEILRVKDLLSTISDQNTATSAATGAMRDATLKFAESGKLNANMKSELLKEIQSLKTIADPSQCNFRMVVESVFIKILYTCKNPDAYIASTMKQFESLLLPTLLAFPLIIAGTATKTDTVKFGTLLRELKSIITTYDITPKIEPFLFDWRDNSLLT